MEIFLGGYVRADFCYIEEMDGPSKDYCDEGNTQYPCVAGKVTMGEAPSSYPGTSTTGPLGTASDLTDSTTQKL